MFKAGYVAVVGLPNAGKSSLVNALVKEKVAIVSSKPQTTRDNIMGIISTDNYQIVLVDTPGVHHSKNALDKAMMKNVRSAVSGVDLILYLIDGTTMPSKEEKEYIAHLEVPTKVIKTKIDLKNLKNFDCDLAISTKTGENLDKLKNMILNYLPSYESKHYIFQPDYYTDKSIKFLIAEEIREKALEILHQEIPHGIALEITRFVEDKKLVYIDADLICENERHKGIIIGKNGQTLKKIGEQARASAEELLSKKVMLNIFVRVEKDWRSKPEKLKNLGY